MKKYTFKENTFFEKEMNGRDAFKQDKKGHGFSVEKEDEGEYSVYGLSTGFCYIYDVPRHQAEEKLNSLKKTKLS